MAAAAETEEVFAIAAAALKEQLTGIRTFALDWEHAVDPMVQPDAPAFGSRVGSISYQARLEGGCCRLDMALWDVSGNCLGKSLSSYDGKFSFGALYNKTNQAKLESLSRTTGNTMLSIITPAAFIGLRFLTFESNKSLATLIDQADRALLVPR